MNKRIYLSILLVLVLGGAVAAGTVLATDGRDLATARQATARYHRMDMTLADGFTPLFECISHPTAGAMGFHYIQAARFDATLELTAPEALVYAPRADGGRELVAIEYIIPAAAWPDSEPPTFLGQTLQYKTTVGPHAVDPYYALHVWIWGHNPSGMFADWNPEVTCPASAITQADATSSYYQVLERDYVSVGRSPASANTQTVSATSPASVGGILEPVIVSVPGSYSGDDAYDPAAGASPERSLIAPETCRVLLDPYDC
jgi:hypothetical protein